MVIERIKPDEIEKFIELREIFIDVFMQDAPALTEQQYAQLRDNRNFVAVGATVGFELVGGLTAHIIPNYYKGGLDFFIYDIAIKREHQRKGVGLELLKFAQQFCKDHGIKEMYVAAEDTDEQALSYYRKTNAEEIGTRFFIYRFD
ncbi:MAG: GNAT family N-acetyltransferase [Crocinitomicaceae bacterium]|nr:GNAT family N-acetyltransferase [Crocinitomicaceae bacterium]